jgi:glutathione synthase/RimK-type ligase-like ATP-grasp enzyme
MNNMKIAYVCYNDLGKYASGVEDEDQILLDFLKKKGLNISREVWNDPMVNWAQYDLAVLKSPWDYFDRIDEFYTWLNKLGDLDLRLLNPSEIVKWNSDKHYLKDIAAASLRVTPTLYFEKGEEPELSDCFTKLETDIIIVKPCISGGSKNTIKLRKDDVVEFTPQIHHFLTEEAYMAQPFLPEIESGGEWSFLFLNGKFSHHLLKRAKPGDFRVQHYLGGSIHTEPAPIHLLQAAEKYSDQFAKNCLYARVDGVEVNGEFMLMELELIEPFLFLFTNPDSYQNYYEALSSLMDQKTNPVFNTLPSNESN